jgi:hypothetical protein
MRKYSIWIEAEAWADGEWNLLDDNTDAIVTFDDGARWVATFYTYQNILSLAEKNKQTGELLSGKYFWASDMILLDEVSRERIEEVVKDLIEEQKFEAVFDQCETPQGIND